MIMIDTYEDGEFVSTPHQSVILTVINNPPPVGGNMRTQYEQVEIDRIEILGQRRKLNADVVSALAASIQQIGLRTPISVRQGAQGYYLIAGAHRLAAVKQLGWNVIPADVFLEATSIEIRLWELSENLHRSDLTAQERADMIAEWVKITEATQTKAKLTKKNSAGEAHGSHLGRPEGGIRAAARALGVDRNEAGRALKIASLAPEAKEVAREVGLDNNQSALLRALDAGPSAKEQAAALREEAKQKRRGPRAVESLEEFADYLMVHCAGVHVPEIITWLEDMDKHGVTIKQIIKRLRMKE